MLQVRILSVALNSLSDIGVLGRTLLCQGRGGSSNLPCRIIAQVSQLAEEIVLETINVQVRIQLWVLFNKVPEAQTDEHHSSKVRVVGSNPTWDIVKM